MPTTSDETAVRIALNSLGCACTCRLNVTDVARCRICQRRLAALEAFERLHKRLESLERAQLPYDAMGDYSEKKGQE